MTGIGKIGKIQSDQHTVCDGNLHGLTFSLPARSVSEVTEENGSESIHSVP